VWNAGKVAASLGLSCLLRRPVVWGRPFVLMVEPTNLCNLKCPLCPSGNGQMSRPRGRMDLQRYEALIDEAGPHLLLLMLWNQGEPFLSPALLEMVRYARARRIPTLTSTNGHFVRTDEEAMAVVESGLDEIIFSLDGVEQATYERYRVGGQLERVLSAIRRVRAARDRAGVRHPAINLQFIAMRHNEEELRAARVLAAELGADTFLVKTAQVYSGEQADAFLPRAEGLRRYAAGPEPLVVKGQPRRGCKVLWYSSTVNWDGTVSPCCFDKDAELAMGRVGAGQALGRLWRGRAYTEFRQRLLRGRGAVAMCRNCSEGYRGMFSLVDPLSG
jgi:MoaA/NifB/PqqE/SkfB family radical SAM enzyme